MMKKIFIYLYLLVIVAFVSSCSTTKKIPQSVSVGNLTQKEYIDKIIDKSNQYDAISAKSIFTLNIDQKNPISVSGTMRIKRGEVVMLSATPLLGIEVARVVITPSVIIILDRLNKRYVKVSYDELNMYLNNNFDYNSLEALFINSIFIPGINTIENKYSDEFKVSKDADNIILNLEGMKKLNYRFVTNSINEQLIESDISLKNSPYSLKWKYDNFKPLSNGEFPSLMSVNIDGMKKKVSLDIELTKLTNNLDWEYSTDIPKKYEQVRLDDILKTLSK